MGWHPRILISAFKIHKMNNTPIVAIILLAITKHDGVDSSNPKQMLAIPLHEV